MTLWVTLAFAAQVSVAAAPDRICVDPRTGYPNVDFVLTNKADKPVAITEIRGLVFDRDGAVIERRLVWQDSLKAIRPDSQLPARGTAVVFNPMSFHNAAPGRRMRFEFDLDEPSRHLRRWRLRRSIAQPANPG